MKRTHRKNGGGSLKKHYDLVILRSGSTAFVTASLGVNRIPRGIFVIGDSQA